MAASQGWIKILRDLGAFSSGRLFYMQCKLFILRQFVPDLWRPLARLSSTVASEREVISGQIARQRSELLDGLVQGGCLRLFAASTAALRAPLAAVPTLATVTTSYTSGRTRYEKAAALGQSYAKNALERLSKN